MAFTDDRGVIRKDRLAVSNFSRFAVGGGERGLPDPTKGENSRFDYGRRAVCAFAVQDATISVTCCCVGGMPTTQTRLPSFTERMQKSFPKRASYGDTPRTLLACTG